MRVALQAGPRASPPRCCLGTRMRSSDALSCAWCDEQEPEDLFETLSQCLLSACNRDALSGWGAVVHIITPKGITSKKLQARQD